MFFDVFSKLCGEHNISTYKACTEIGLNRSAVAKWKAGGTPNGTTLSELAKYFNVSVDYLLGKTENRLESANAPDAPVSILEMEYIKKYRSLNENGKAKVNDYIDDLIFSNKYSR